MAHDTKELLTNDGKVAQSSFATNHCYKQVFIMIYISYRNSNFDNSLSINNVWEVNCNNVQEKYIEFMHEKAKEINVVINPHWLNIMNWQDHNNHLSIGEYGNKEKQWNKIKRQWNVDRFISEILKGRKRHYETIVRF